MLISVNNLLFLHNNIAETFFLTIIKTPYIVFKKNNIGTKRIVLIECLVNMKNTKILAQKV